MLGKHSHINTHGRNEFIIKKADRIRNNIKMSPNRDGATKKKRPTLARGLKSCKLSEKWIFLIFFDVPSNNGGFYLDQLSDKIDYCPKSEYFSWYYQISSEISPASEVSGINPPTWTEIEGFFFHSITKSWWCWPRICCHS